MKFEPQKNEFEVIWNEPYLHYRQTKPSRPLDPERAGKWCLFQKCSQEVAARICAFAVAKNEIAEAKHPLFPKAGGVFPIFLYCNGDDREGHAAILHFLFAMGLLPKNRDGTFKNISFQYDRQTNAGQYGDNFQAEICLYDFLKDPKKVEDIPLFEGFRDPVEEGTFVTGELAVVVNKTFGYLKSL